ncbi:hypothetical protein MPC4_130007 [Methylocella tundrae]|uniref:Uncharacterized protein n=1 Tax=Methylocella tundrae TaxID=227605 RepID=A0A8B6M2B6_METTU|nr:hypothetical protein MPC4_130007 [Methylocella tundrae]
MQKASRKLEARCVTLPADFAGSLARGPEPGQDFLQGRPLILEVAGLRDEIER